ncbi:MAG: hypothetical protein M0Z28_03455 [Rhodospirillales bacterium]|nr:hypothetical protein [Rhodospirillales bacterium]
MPPSTAGTVGIAAGESATQVAASTTCILQQNGHVNGKNGVTASVNAPPEQRDLRAGGAGLLTRKARGQKLDLAVRPGL